MRRTVATLSLNADALISWPESVFKEKHGVWDPMPEFDYNSPFLIVNSVVIFMHRSVPLCTVQFDVDL